MKKIISILAIAFFTLGMSQEDSKKACCSEKDKKECSKKDKKACDHKDKDKKTCNKKDKKACCDTKGKKAA